MRQKDTIPIRCFCFVTSDFCENLSVEACIRIATSASSQNTNLIVQWQNKAGVSVLIIRLDQIKFNRQLFFLS